MAADNAQRRVIAAYPAECQPQQVRFLGGAGGFSGAQFWLLDSPLGRLCLRRWPREHPRRERLEFIQAVLWHVHQEGFRRLPLPLETRTHAGYVVEAGHLWELTPWLPGRADYHAAPSPRRLSNAVSTLAEFHRAAVSFPLPERGPAVSTGVSERLQLLCRCTPQRLDELATASRPSDWPELDSRRQQWLSLFPLSREEVLHSLVQAARLEVPLQPCIRDIWHDHVLFVGDEVSGLVDFGALRPESVAADLARLLGSLAGDDGSDWQLGLEAYQKIRPLSVAEALLVTAFDRSQVLLASLSWLEWIYLEGRRFDDRTAVLARLDENLERLAKLTARA